MTRLDKPINIGRMKVKNRYVMPPMNTNYSDENGSITDQMTKYYVRRAQGGVGLIVIEAASIVSNIINHGVQPLIHDEKYIPAWANMVEKIKRYGAKVSIEIAHYGSEGIIGPKVSASDVSSISNEVKPLTVEEIDEIVEQFADAVVNAKKAGFDTVTLHAAHGYLLAEFLSPLYNKRQDEYGGTLENRMRILIKIIERCRKKVGNNFPIMVRYSADEFITGGRGINESVEIAKILEKNGVDALDISASVPASYLFCMPPYSISNRFGFLVPYTKEIKKAVNIPVICASGIRTPEQAEEIVAKGYADMIAIGRTLIADPDFCNKAFSGQDNIRECLSCQYCIETLNSGRSLRCTVNAEAGREYEFEAIEPAKIRKKVTVIGAGPAGMEAARISAIRGHEVTLIEKTDRLGGTLNAGAVPPNKAQLLGLVKWYESQLKKLDVKIKFDDIDNTRSYADADVLILACGASYVRRIKGSDQKTVISATEALRNPEIVGENLVIIGGGVSGCEVAEYFAGERVKVDFLRVKNLDGEIEYKTEIDSDIAKKNITIIEMLDDICNDMDAFNRPLMKINLKEKSVKIMTGTMAQSINDHSVSVKSIKTDIQKELPADTVVLSSGLIPNTINDIEELDSEIYWVGDCSQPGKISDAIYSAYYTARHI